MFDLSKFTKTELLLLNRQIVEKLKQLESQQICKSMNDFTIGDKVFFTPPGEKKVKGIVIKKNRKTISILDNSSHQWNVPPLYLEHQGSENIVEADWEVIQK